MISVVMATYNGEHYIREQLMSILTQSRLPDEVIITDDGSEDNTIEIINSIIAETGTAIVTLIQNDVRLGYAKNFSKAIETSKGDIIFLSDQDDLWHQDKIAQMSNILNSNDSIRCLNSTFNLIDETGTVIKKGIDNGTVCKIEKQSFIRHPKYPGMAMALRRVLWNNIPNEYKERVAAHDWLICYQAVWEEGLYLINKTLCDYRQHGSNESGMLQTQTGANKKDQRLRTINNIINNLCSVLSEENPDYEMLNNALEFQKKRCELIEGKKLPELIALLLKNREFISAKSIVGDIYSLS